MKKILLVGQFTDQFRKVNKELTGKYEVRACVNKLEIFRGMFKLNKPDIVVMILQELDEINEELLKELKKEYKEIPVVYTGVDLNDEKPTVKEVTMGDAVEYFEDLGLEKGSKEFWFDISADIPEVRENRYSFTMFHSVWPDEIAHMFARVILK